MRLHLELSPSVGTVPFDHLPALVGAMHKWIGEANAEHGATSLYSFSWLQGGKRVGSGLRFPEGARMFFSAHDSGLASRVVSGILKDPAFAYGMRVTDVRLQETPRFGNRQVFRTASPVLVRRGNGKGQPVDHLPFSDPDADALLTKTLQTKLTLAGLPVEGVSVAFDREASGAKTKLVRYKEIGNKASLCPVIVEGTPEQVQFAYKVGVGNSTGVGFGAIN